MSVIMCRTEWAYDEWPRQLRSVDESSDYWRERARVVFDRKINCGN